MPLPTSNLGEAPVKAAWRLLPGTIHHVFTHFSLELTVAVATSSARCEGQWVAPERLEREALPSVMRKIVRHVRDYEGEGKRD